VALQRPTGESEIACKGGGQGTGLANSPGFVLCGVKLMFGPDDHDSLIGSREKTGLGQGM